MRESILRGWRAVRALLGVWRRRLRERDELSRMTGAELRDAGMNRYEASLEIRKPFWRA